MNIEHFGNAKEENLTLQEAPYFSNIVRVGWPSPADDYVERSIDLNEYLIKNPASTYFVRVSGDSMVDASIGDGALLIVDRSIEPKHKNIVIAAINGSFTCKRLILKPKICLMPENLKYKPIYINKDEELELAGTVIAAINIY